MFYHGIQANTFTSYSRYPASHGNGTETEILHMETRQAAEIQILNLAL